MPSIPVWLIGKHVTACSITPQTAAASGSLTGGSLQTLVGNLDEISIQSANTTENISPMDHRQGNQVPIETNSQIVLTEILKSNGTNFLAAFSYGATDYGLFGLTRGGQAFSFYGVVLSYSETIRKGKSVATLTLGMVDMNGTANPAYA